MSLRDELVQVAAVALAVVRELDTGSTEMPDKRYYCQEMIDVFSERHRQERKWGTRTDTPIAEWVTILGEEFGEVCKAALEEVMYPGSDDAE